MLLLFFFGHILTFYIHSVANKGGSFLVGSWKLLTQLFGHKAYKILDWNFEVFDKRLTVIERYMPICE